PAWFAVPQPVVKTFARERPRRVGVQAGGLVHHQHMVVFKNQARQHGSHESNCFDRRKHRFEQEAAEAAEASKGNPSANSAASCSKSPVLLKRISSRPSTPPRRRAGSS